MQPAADSKADSYYQGVREEIIAFIPAGVARVLDVGCGEGGFGSHLKSLRGCEVWGIEIVPAAAAIASNRLDRVLCGDVLEMIDRLPDDGFDVVVFNDVLEHLVDPYRVLDRIRGLIRPQGVVVSSIPSIRYYPVMYALLAHRSWEYEESGILDRTHLRFFTERSIREMYERLGYDILRHEGINRLDHLPLRYRIVNTILRGRLDDMRYVQFPTVARPRGSIVPS